MKTTIEDSSKPKLLTFAEFAKLPNGTLGVVENSTLNSLSKYIGVPVKTTDGVIFGLTPDVSYWMEPWVVEALSIRVLPAGSRVILEQE